MNIQVIHRIDRPERYEHIIREFAAQSLNPAVFNAIIDSTGWKGCRDSHINILEQNDVNRLTLIFEDDVMFVNSYFLFIYDILNGLPDDWDCVYLGGSPQKPQERYSEHLYKASGVLTTHAILWHHRLCGAVDFILNDRDNIGKWDVYLKDIIQPNFNCFLTKPMICTQRDGFQSDTCRRSDVSTIIRNYNLYCK
jgi:hypothetical protein